MNGIKEKKNCFQCLLFTPSASAWNFSNKDNNAPFHMSLSCYLNSEIFGAGTIFWSLKVPDNCSSQICNINC